MILSTKKRNKCIVLQFSRQKEAEPMDNQDANLQNENTFELMKKFSAFDIIPCENALDLKDKSRFEKLSLTSEQKIQVSALSQQVPQAIATGTMAQAYIATFPEGLPHTLTALRQGGVGSPIRGETGFIGSASFYSLSTLAALMGAFTVVSAVTGQYFLSQINQELNVINQNISEILQFLYKEKKSELIAEVKFTQYAYQNYTSIMTHEAQRIATLCSLQHAKKIAMKDIDFYLNDLSGKIDSIISPKKYSKSDTNSEQSPAEICIQIEKSIDLAIQLYVTSSFLEVYYSQNFDSAYIDFSTENIYQQIDDYRTRMLTLFSSLKGCMGTASSEKDGFKQKISLSFIAKGDNTSDIQTNNTPDQINQIINNLSSRENLISKEKIKSILNTPKRESTYFFTSDGDVYFEKL